MAKLLLSCVLLALVLQVVVALPENPRSALLDLARQNPDLKSEVLDAIAGPITEEVLRRFFAVRTVSVSTDDNSYSKDIAIANTNKGGVCPCP